MKHKDRKALMINITWVFGAVFVVVIATFGAAIYSQFMQNSAQSAISKSRTAYQDMIYFEEVMNAECATDRRGVFNQDAVTDGEFECLTSTNSIRLGFDIRDSTNYSYAVTPGSPPTVETLPTVTAVGGFGVDTRLFPIVIRADDDTYSQAELFVGVVNRELSCEAAGGVCQDVDLPCNFEIASATCGASKECCALEDTPNVGSP